MSRAVIFVNGVLPSLTAARALLRPDDIFLAADGGARLALRLGVMPEVVLGDMDSMDEETRAALERGGTDFQVFPRDKDETDLELALFFALKKGAREVRVLGASGGRLDQTLANLALLGNDAFAALDLRADDGVEEAFFVRDHAEIQGRSGEVVSLIPLGVAAEGVFTENLRWVLRGETLYPHQTRGVSNEMTGTRASVRLKAGMLFCVHRRMF